MDLNKHFDLDSMLYEDAVWLSGRTVLPKGQFLNIASKMDLRQQDWDTFWKRVRIMKYDEEPNIKCVIYGKRWKLNSYRDWETDRKSTRLNSSHSGESRMPSSA